MMVKQPLSWIFSRKAYEHAAVDRQTSARWRVILDQPASLSRIHPLLLMKTVRTIVQPLSIQAIINHQQQLLNVSNHRNDHETRLLVGTFQS